MPWRGFSTTDQPNGRVRYRVECVHSSYLQVYEALADKPNVASLQAWFDRQAWHGLRSASIHAGPPRKTEIIC